MLNSQTKLGRPESFDVFLVMADGVAAMAELSDHGEGIPTHLISQVVHLAEEHVRQIYVVLDDEGSDQLGRDAAKVSLDGIHAVMRTWAGIAGLREHSSRLAEIAGTPRN